MSTRDIIISDIFDLLEDMNFIRTPSPSICTTVNSVVLYALALLLHRYRYLYDSRYDAIPPCEYRPNRYNGPYQPNYSEYGISYGGGQEQYDDIGTDIRT